MFVNERTSVRYRTTPKTDIYLFFRQLCIWHSYWV